jgi:hypothetical protein
MNILGGLGSTSLGVKFKAGKLGKKKDTEVGDNEELGSVKDRETDPCRSNVSDDSDPEILSKVLGLR